MAKFYGKIGFGSTVEIRPGVWQDAITARSYYGDVVRNSLQLQAGEMLNPNLTPGNSISIVADAYANEHISAIRYIEWAGALWSVSTIEVQSPRLLLRLGGVYNGPRPTP